MKRYKTGTGFKGREMTRLFKNFRAMRAMVRSFMVPQQGLGPAEREARNQQINEFLVAAITEKTTLRAYLANGERPVLTFRDEHVIGGMFHPEDYGVKKMRGLPMRCRSAMASTNSFAYRMSELTGRRISRCASCYPWNWGVVGGDLLEFNHGPFCHTHYNRMMELERQARLEREREEERAAERRQVAEHILPHNTDVVTRFNLSLDHKKRLFGVELECCFKNRKRDVVGLTMVEEAISDWGIIKSDGSLPDWGIEIVSKPETLEEHRKIWAQFAPARKLLYAWDEPKCGLHVHVSRGALTPLAIGRMDRFINDYYNREFVDIIAGRRSNRFCNRDTNRGITHSYHGLPNTWGRYSALNFDTKRNRETIEFRLFRGNVSENGVMRAIEFCDALCNWSAIASNQFLSWPYFLRWLEKNRGTYPALTRFLVSSHQMEAIHKFKEEIVLCA